MVCSITMGLYYFVFREKGEATFSSDGREGGRWGSRLAACIHISWWNHQKQSPNKNNKSWDKSLSLICLHPGHFECCFFLFVISFCLISQARHKKYFISNLKIMHLNRLLVWWMIQRGKQPKNDFANFSAKYSIKISPLRTPTCMKLSVPAILPMWWNWYAPVSLLLYVLSYF